MMASPMPGLYVCRRPLIVGRDPEHTVQPGAPVRLEPSPQYPDAMAFRTEHGCVVTVANFAVPDFFDRATVH
jgi:hypothetical protein